MYTLGQRMGSWRRAVPRVAAVAVLGFATVAMAACGGSGSGGSSSKPAPSGSSASSGSAASGGSTAPAGKATVDVASSSAGKILVDSKGMTLYTYSADKNGKPDCNSSCLALWPALVATGSPSAGAGVTGKLGTVSNLSGQKQVTYNGKPLYTYVVDKQAGQTTGQGVKDSLGVWSIAKP